MLVCFNYMIDLVGNITEDNTFFLPYVMIAL